MTGTDCYRPGGRRAGGEPLTDRDRLPLPGHRARPFHPAFEPSTARSTLTGLPPDGSSPRPMTSTGSSRLGGRRAGDGPLTDRDRLRLQGRRARPFHPAFEPLRPGSTLAGLPPDGASPWPMTSTGCSRPGGRRAGDAPLTDRDRQRLPGRRARPFHPAFEPLRLDQHSRACRLTTPRLAR